MRFIVSKESMFKDNPSLEMFPQFEKLRDREMKWIALVYDYDSPLAQMPLPIRQKKAGHMVGHSFDDKDNPTGKLKEMLDGADRDVIEAVKEYKKIQYDENKETLLAYNEQLDQFREFMRRTNKKASELKFAQSLQKQMPDLLKAREEIAKIVGFRADDDYVGDDHLNDLSMIEKIIYEEEKEKSQEYD